MRLATPMSTTLCSKVCKSMEFVIMRNSSLRTVTRKLPLKSDKVTAVNTIFLAPLLQLQPSWARRQWPDSASIFRPDFSQTGTRDLSRGCPPAKRQGTDLFLQGLLRLARAQIKELLHVVRLGDRAFCTHVACPRHRQVKAAVNSH